MKLKSARFLSGVTISSHSTLIAAPSTSYDPREETMKRTKSEAERDRPKRMELAKQYRPIGPAAIQAALICTAKRRKTSASSAAKAA